MDFAHEIFQISVVSWTTVWNFSRDQAKFDWPLATELLLGFIPVYFFLPRQYRTKKNDFNSASPKMATNTSGDVLKIGMIELVETQVFFLFFFFFAL